MPFDIVQLTYGEAIKRIARMVGHPVPTDPAGSIDPAVAQMGEAINVAMEELLGLHEWQDLTQQGSISVVQDTPGQQQKSYDLPEDFYRIISQSEWTQSMPANGPISAQHWQAGMSSVVVNSFGLSWQIRADKIWFFTPPATPTPFDFMYISLAQVIDGDDSTLLKNVANKNSDKFMLNPSVVMLLGRVKYLEWKGFDASGAMRDFLMQYNSKTGADKSAPVLNIAGPTRLRLIGERDVPETGFGL